MREIKFRIWDKRTSKMSVPDWLDENGNVYDDEAFDSPGYRQKATYELMQFTGLHDKNGVEIYEGDILVLDLKEWADVNLPEVFTVKTDEFHNDICYLSSIVSDLGSEPIEVIGNIFEDGELLNDRKGKETD